MTPLSGNVIKSGQNTTVNDNPATDAGAQNDPEYDPTTGCRSISGLRNGKAIGIIFEANGLPKAAEMSRSKGFPLSTMLLEFRNKPVRVERAPGVAIPTVANAPICDCALRISSTMARIAPE